VTPKYTSPSRRETCREAQYRAAMNTPGRYQPDGCWVQIGNLPSNPDAPLRFVQLNRKFRRSGGRASY
jgi:hypothetical protein